MRGKFETRRNLMVEGLRAIPGVDCLSPNGAFYAFPDFTRALAALDPGAGITDDTQLAAFLLEKARVAVVPGEAFGAPGHRRLSYATGEATITEGIRRIREALAGISRA
jgi:aspartate aminotransferase